MSPLKIIILNVYFLFLAASYIQRSACLTVLSPITQTRPEYLSRHQRQVFIQVKGLFSILQTGIVLSLLKYGVLAMTKGWAQRTPSCLRIFGIRWGKLGHSILHTDLVLSHASHDKGAGLWPLSWAGGTNWVFESRRLSGVGHALVIFQALVCD